MIKLEVDGKEVEIEQGSALIQACEKAGVTIPRWVLALVAICWRCRVLTFGHPSIGFATMIGKHQSSSLSLPPLPVLTTCLCCVRL
jgi:predicted molibdopterin-dependent oxidoreductase YjgC